MPRYFFHIYNGSKPQHLDEEGEELPDRQAAWKEATESVGQTIRDLDGRLRPGSVWRMEVTDEFANRIYVIEIQAHEC